MRPQEPEGIDPIGLGHVRWHQHQHQQPGAGADAAARGADDGGDDDAGVEGAAAPLGGDGLRLESGAGGGESGGGATRWDLVMTWRTRNGSLNH